MNLSNLLSLLWRKKWILIIVPILAVIAALIFRMTGEWKFRSSSLISTGLTISDDVSAGKYLNPYEVQVSFNNLIETVKSRTVIDQAGYALAIHDLEHRDTPYRKLKPEELHKIGIDNLNNPERFLQILKAKNEKLQLLDSSDPEEKKVSSLLKTMGYDHETLLKELSMSRVNQSDFIEVSFVSENPMLSAFVVNTVCSEFIRYYTSLKAIRSNSSVESLEFIALQRKQVLEQRQQALQEFKSNTDIVNSKVETEGKLRKKENYEEDITNEQQNIKSLELTLSSLDERIASATSSNGNNRNAQILSMQGKIDKMNSRFIVGGQKDKALSDSVTMLKAQLTSLLDESRVEVITPEVLTNLRERRHEVQNQLNIARANLETLLKNYNTVVFRLGSSASKEAMNSALEKDVEVAREDYINAQNRLSAAKEKAIINRLPIQQVLKAEPADKAESNKTLIFMVFSGALSFIFSVFAIVAIDLMDSRIKTPERLKTLSRLKIAGVFPKMPSPKSPDKGKPPVFQLSGVRVKGKDEIRKIRYEIERSNARTILTTSTKVGQGKSFFVRALAYSFSLQKKRVLIIDTNFRNNSLTQIFVAQPALKLLIESFVSERKLLTSSDFPQQPKPKSNLITHTENNWIDFIGNKQVQTTPSELINGEDFSQFIEWLKTQYHYIIMEGPALNVFSDTKELVPFVDIVIPVFSADATINGEDAESLNYLKSLQEKLGPAVLNNYEKPK